MKKAIVLVPLLALACGPGREGGSDRVVIQNKGSDTLVNVAQAWAEAYREVNPNVAVAVTGGGSGTGISAMINGTVDIANASRRMSEEEIAAATANGHEPVEYIVGFDALAIFLHPDNPITQMSREQLRQIYGDGGTFTRWSDLGVTVPGCPSDEIVVVSRQNNSGTYVYFRDEVLGEEGDFRLGTRDMHGSKDVVDLVENTPCAIGYSGLAYANEHVTMPCIESGDGGCVAPTVQTALDGSYPIARPLIMYTSGQPTGAVKAYIDWIESPDGQCIIKEQGYAPVHDITCA
ncbi:MAG: phosphate ABC transporter substrate-binding protein [Gemmatimonadota bacterium]|nr:phosphate ABC transporter substrate-binding protein [Gemmatimonadota bacterium]